MASEVTIEGEYLAIRDNGIYMGSLILKDLEQPACYIEAFEIEEKSKGYGSFLFDIAVELAKSKCCEAVSLHCSISNENALRFYKRKGMFIYETTPQKRYDAYINLKERHYLLTIKI